MFLCGYNKAYLARPHFVHKYLELCGEELGRQLEERGLEVSLARTTYSAEMTPTEGDQKGPTLGEPGCLEP